ncbi:hypothetical protein HU200_003348 [Digitaria exilis]|uniref:Protein kinase domain-containing protein n=1 Tax=Digitaria exilis TaxID=1010633 RepID=A0A835FWQ0_9POAL|nr:hypothetical protein HU200_003348 [Digitaria exilis]
MPLQVEAMTFQQVPWYLLIASTLVIISQQLVLLVPPAVAADTNTAPSPVPAPLPGCPSMCGDVEIPNPFGIGHDCSWKGEFTLTCNHSFSPPRPYVGNMEVIDINLESGEGRVYSPVASICYNSSNTATGSSWTVNFTGTVGLISSTRNEFTAIGCSTMAYIAGKEDWSFLTGCMSTCVSLDEAADDGAECTGFSCCQTDIPPNISVIQIGWSIVGNGTPIGNPGWRYNPCSYAFVAEKGWYHFQRRDLTRLGNLSFTDRVGERTIPVVLDWAIRSDGPCQLPLEESGTSAKPTASACVSAHSYCTNATQGPGYLCKCSTGYTGNPYTTGGCTNINECELRKTNPSIYEKQYPCGSNSKCHDIMGDYECKCKFGHRGDGKSEKGCRPIFPGYATAIVVTFISMAIVVLLLCLLHKEYKRRIRRGFFDRNGGKILKDVNIKTFSEEELNKITNNYKDPIGKGAFGMVFKGTNDDNQLVAVKRPILEGEKPRQGGEFIQEITFQFQIRHTNLGRLIGCCLETSVPRLVFEFVPNGSLYNILHGTNNKPRSLSLQQRLDIAIGSAEALAYMHSHDEHNKRIHGDIKSGNILLDDDLNPKVSDFGSSKLVSTASRYATWLVSGDMNYIDPAYTRTGRFTEKSDVYSFGVVLLELITRKKAMYDGSNSLPINFVKTCRKEGNGRKMYDRDILSDDAQSRSQMECLDRIGELAVQCLKEDVDDRPSMAEVLEELKQTKLTACGGSDAIL